MWRKLAASAVTWGIGALPAYADPTVDVLACPSNGYAAGTNGVAARR